VSTGTPGYDRARTLLAALPVKGWDRHTDFSCYRSGEPWSDDVEVKAAAGLPAVGVGEREVGDGRRIGRLLVSRV
jgi:hypothetical protein